MKRFCRNVIALASIGTFAGTSYSAAQEYMKQANALLLCYDTAAIAYAVRSCEPSATLVQAVFGKCAESEQEFRSAVDDYASTTTTNPEFSGIVLQQVREGAKPKLFSTIISARITAGKNCP